MNVLMRSKRKISKRKENRRRERKTRKEGRVSNVNYLQKEQTKKGWKNVKKMKNVMVIKFR